MLAIHGLNQSLGSSDFLIAPALRGGVIQSGNNNQPVIDFGAIEFNPASTNQDEEYIQLVNNNASAVDMSDWTLSGGVDFTFQPAVE